MSEQEDRKLQAQRDEFSRTLNHLAAKLGGGGGPMSGFNSMPVGGGRMSAVGHMSSPPNGAAVSGTAVGGGGGGFSGAEERIMQQLQVLPKVLHPVVLL